MDRGRKAMPVQNKACMERYIKKCQERHKSKLRNMKSSIDNRCPRKATNLRSNAKKNYLIEERIDQIETENRHLLEKMSNIMRLKSSGIDNKNDNIKYSHSLNNEKRKRELQKITEQNYQILRRIQQARARPLYNH